MNLLIEKYGSQTKDIDYLILVLTSNELFTPEKLQSLDEITQEIESLEPIYGSITPLNLMTFRREGKRLRFLPLSKEGKAPATEEDLKKFKDIILSDPLARNLVLSEDASSFCLIFPIHVLEEYGEFLNRLEKIIVRLEKDFKTRIAGWIPLHDATRRYIIKDPPRLIAIAAFVTLLVFFISFRTLRAVLLPILTISISMVWTLGIMSLARVPLNVVSIMIPPLIFALGSSYSIHILNQYYYEAAASSNDNRWIVPAISHITKTVIMASVTTAIGFGSLLFSTIAAK